MNIIDRSSIDETEWEIASSIIELQQKLGETIQQLSPERLKVLADFAAYLEDIEREAATQELLEIPGLLEQVRRNQSLPKEQFVDWRSVRSDV